MFGGKNDGGKHDDPIIIQVKSGPSNFSEKLWSLLQSLSPTNDQLKAVVVASADGPGTKRRAYIVLEFSDFIKKFKEVGND